MDEGSFFKEREINAKLKGRIASLGELKGYLKVKFGDYRCAAQAAGISEGRVRQILIGYCMPKTSRLINKIAFGWKVDPVNLALIFDNIKGEKAQHKDVVSSANLENSGVEDE